MPKKLIKANPAFLTTITVILALFAYFWGLSDLQIPKIGDEVLYQQIARVTGESGTWLPLRYEGGIMSTKPPLLYWLGMATTNKGLNYTLFSLRAPIVLITLLGALLLYQLIFLRTRNTEHSLWGAALYLSFISTFQHGRPFLVNSFEVLFLLYPLVLYWHRKRWDALQWISTTLCWGAVSWAKSFALIGVGVLALFASSIPFESFEWCLKKNFKKLLFLGSAFFVSLLIFSLWFVFDPDPKLLFQQFIIGENAVKFKGYSTYFSGLFSGIYPVWRIWLGALANAGLGVFLLIGAGVTLYQNRKSLSADQKTILYVIFSFLVFYTLPTQRQENYILPTMALWAVLIAELREKIPFVFFKIGFALIVFAFVVLSLAPFILNVWNDLETLTKCVFVVSLLVFLFISLRVDIRKAYPALIFLIYIQLANLSQPFSKSFLYFSKGQPTLKSTIVYVPSRKLAQHERFRFRIPEITPIAYDPAGIEEFCRNAKSGTYAVIEDDQQALCPQKQDVLEEVKDFKTRQSFAEILKIAGGESEYLVRKLKLVQFVD